MLSGLKHLTLDRCGVRQIPADLFLHSPQIVSLELPNNKLKSLPSFKQLPNVEVLDIKFNELDDSFFMDIGGPKVLSRAKTLDISHNQLKSFAPAVDLMSSSHHLQNIDLRHQMNSEFTFLRQNESPLYEFSETNK